jgi:hypothetical protein
MLARKQSSYSQASVNELLTDQFAFNCKKHIIDPGDLLSLVSGLRLAAQERVLAEFRHILGEVDAYISFSLGLCCEMPTQKGKRHLSRYASVGTGTEVILCKLF